MRILVIQNDPITPTGIVGERIAAQGIAVDTVLPHDGGALPAASDG